MTKSASLKNSMQKCGKILRGRKDTLAPVVSTLRGRAPWHADKQGEKQTNVKEPPRTNILTVKQCTGGSVAEWLVCWTQAQKGPGSNHSRPLSGNSLRQTVHTHRASVHHVAKLVAALLRVAGVTACLAESNVSLPPGL